MVLQQEMQNAEMPPQFGELLSEAPARLSSQNDSAVQEFKAVLNNAATKSPKRTHKAIQVAELVSEFEADLITSEQLVGRFLENFVNLVRQAAQDDEKAHAFDVWADGQDLAEALETFEKKVAPLFREHAATFRKIVRGWNRRARAGEIEPDLPENLANRVKRLNTRINRLTRQITKREDNELIAWMLIRVARHRPLSGAEKIRLSDAVRMKVKYKVEPSIHREDWYGEDGR